MSKTSRFRRNAFRIALLVSLVSATPSIGQDQASRNTGRTVKATPASAVSNAPTDAANADAGPVVVAVVNSQPITLNELAEQCRIRHGAAIVDDLVSKTTILQACQAQNITITEKDVNNEISRTAMKFNLTSKMYLKLIQDERDISEEQYAADVIWPMLALRALAKDSIEVSPQEIDREFQGQFGAKVKVRMIACQDRAKLEKLHAQATANPDSFKKLARDHSDDPASASVEGLLPPIRRFTGDDELESIAFALQPNEVSRIFEAGGMYVTLQCVQHIPAASPPAAQMQEIQARIKSDIEETKTRGSAERVYTALRDNSTVTVVFGNPELEKQHPNVVAIVNGQSIPMESLDRVCVKRFGPKVLGGEINRKLVENAVNAAQIRISQEDIDQEIRATAEYFGVLNSQGQADVPAWMEMIAQEENLTPELYVRDVSWPTVALKKLTAAGVSVTDEDITKGFESNYGPRAEVLAIVFSNQRTAQQVWEMARSNPTEQFFGELATQYSVEDSSRSNFGKVPPLRRHSGQPTLEKAAFSLQPGEMSGVIEVNGRYLIMKLQGFTTPVVSSLDDTIKRELHREILEKKQRIAMDSCLAKLREDAEITNFLEPKKSRVSSQDTRAAMELLQTEAVR